MSSPITELKITKPISSTNWRGLWTLYSREVRRFVKIIGQTLLAPIITTILFLIVFVVAFGKDRQIGELSYTEFLVPGLMMMAILQNAFANTSTSIISQKLNENIIDTLMPPLSPFELVVGYVMGGATRGLVVAIGVGFGLSLVIPISINNISMVVFHALGAASIMGALGMITGIWAEKFDHVSTVTNFIILPLSFLSGTFFPITRFPELLHNISYYNPFFYMIDGLRYGFSGQSFGSLLTGIIYVLSINFALWIICYWLVKSGYKLKA